LSSAVRTPACTYAGLGSFPFARRYLGNRVFFLLLRLLRCFSSPGSLPYVMDWRMDTWSLSRWVSPFRDLRIIGYLLLPEAFRSLSRLSSALGAKASALCSFLLGLSDAIALTSDGLLVFLYHCSRSASLSSLSYVKRIIKKRMFYICGFQGTVHNRIKMHDECSHSGVCFYSVV